jgi:hypothetical protein
MGLFETPLVLGIVAVLLVAFAVLRWRGRRSDEWQHERLSPAPATSTSRETGERSPERP